jgi:hypothetical protein
MWEQVAHKQRPQVAHLLPIRDAMKISLKWSGVGRSRWPRAAEAQRTCKDTIKGRNQCDRSTA